MHEIPAQPPELARPVALPPAFQRRWPVDELHPRDVEDFRYVVMGAFANMLGGRHGAAPRLMGVELVQMHDRYDDYRLIFYFPEPRDRYQVALAPELGRALRGCNPAHLLHICHGFYADACDAVLDRRMRREEWECRRQMHDGVQDVQAYVNAYTQAPLQDPPAPVIITADQVRAMEAAVWNTLRLDGERRAYFGAGRSPIPRWTNEAQAKGMQLLKENLTPEQLAQYEVQGFFEVIGSETGARYRVTSGRSSFNVHLLDGGNVVEALCFVPEGHLVEGDVMLAQKIALENCENHARSTANIARL